MAELKASIGQYTLGRTLGEGTFGKVRIATHNLTQEKVAVKILEKDRVTDVADVERVAREIHILKIIRHPNLIQLFEIVETTKQLYLITEYATGGELYDYIVANKKLKEKEACRLFQQIISGVDYIHKLHIVHRDLKPENLLLDDSKNVKLVDFGLSNTYKQDEKLRTACGSPCYAAPEMIAGKKYSGLQVDIWSAGVVLFSLLCGHPPFEDPNTGNLYKKILSGDYTLPNFLSSSAKELLKGILNIDPKERLTIDEIKEHAWYGLYPTAPREGIVVGVHQIPTEDRVLRELGKYGFDAEYTKKCVEANKHNAATTTYYLLLQKFVREGGCSPADISSPLFEPATIGKRLKQLRELPQLDKAQILINTSLSKVSAHKPISENAHRISELNKIEGTGGSSSHNEETFKKTENPAIHNVCYSNTEGKQWLGKDDILKGKLKEYVFNLSLNFAEAQRKKLGESIDLNATVPLRKASRKLRLPEKEDFKLERKYQSTRAQGWGNGRTRKRSAQGSRRPAPLDASVTPSAARGVSAKRVSCSPKCDRKVCSHLNLNKTCRIKKKYTASKTPSRRLK